MAHTPPDTTPAQHVPLPASDLTYVELFWVEGVKEHWLRFGRQAADRIIEDRKSVV